MVRNTALDTDPRSMMTRKEVTTRNTTEKGILTKAEVSPSHTVKPCQTQRTTTNAELKICTAGG